MKIIVGLGNPDKKYDGTRHNVGFMILDHLAGADTWRENKKFRALTLEKNGDLFVKPLTYMNRSGESVQAILSYYHLLPKKLGLFKIKDVDISDTLVVIHDDLDVDLGKYKATNDSRSAGHRGVESIINQLHTQKFKRLRIGIRPITPSPIPTEKFVLQKLSPGEWTQISTLFPSITQEIK